MVLEKTLESPLDCKEIQPVKTQGNKQKHKNNKPWVVVLPASAYTEAGDDVAIDLFDSVTYSVISIE